MASSLVRSTPERAVRVESPGRGHRVVFLLKTLYSHGASLHPGVYKGTDESIADLHVVVI